jgi:hypothetical protein
VTTGVESDTENRKGRKGNMQFMGENKYIICPQARNMLRSFDISAEM